MRLAPAKTVFSLAFNLYVLCFMFGCALKSKVPPAVSIELARDQARPVVADEAPIPVEQIPQEPEIPGAEVPTPVLRIIPKIALIFSGGGAKAWAHIGFLKEIENAKWPIHAVAGFEWGAVVAAVYANNFSANEVEWELSKVRDFENLAEIGDIIFAKKAVSDLKIPFVCASLNISQQTLYLLNHGPLNILIPYCLAQPPLSQPYLQSIAEMHDIASLAQHLRGTGANKIILVNVLAQITRRPFTADSLSAENILWVKAAVLMAKPVSGVDDIININLDAYELTDFNKKREIIAKGAAQSFELIRKLSKKYGL